MFLLHPHGSEDLKIKYLKTKNVIKFLINCSQYLYKSGFHMLDEFIAGSLQCQIITHQDLLLEDSIWQHGDGEAGVSPIGDALSYQGEHHQPHRSMAVPVQWWRISQFLKIYHQQEHQEHNQTPHLPLLQILIAFSTVLISISRLFSN